MTRWELTVPVGRNDIPREPRQQGVKPLATRIARAYINALPEGRYRSGQTGRTVNPLAYAFAGSNPALPSLLYYIVQYGSGLNLSDNCPTE